MLLTWLDFGPVCSFYPVVFVLLARIGEEVAADLCSSSQVEVGELVLRHAGPCWEGGQSCFREG